MKIGTSYFGNRMLHHLEEDLEFLKRKGFTEILHTVSEYDWRFYEGTMKALIEKSKEKGFTVTVSPWALGLVFGGEAFSEFHIHYPEACQQTLEGRKLPQACFNHPTFKGFMKRWIDAVHDMGADCILWDEPHWAGEGGWHSLEAGERACFCSVCEEQFKKENKIDIKLAGNTAFRSFREESMKQFIAEMSAYSKQLQMKNIICFFPDRTNLHIPALWEEVAALESMDIFATDPYWVGSDVDVETYVDYYTQAAVEIGKKTGKEVQLYIQNFRIKAGFEHEVEIAVRVGLSYGIQNFYTWGFNSCGHMSFLASDNPEGAFRAFYEPLQERGMTK